MTKINVLGTCVCRDFFGLKENNGGYIIPRFLQSIDPLAAVTETPLSNKLDVDLFNEALSDQPNFYKKIFRLDLTRHAFEYLSEEDCDYLLVDIGSIRYDLYKYVRNGINCYQPVYLPEKLDLFRENGWFPEDAELVDIDDIDEDEFEQLIKSYADRLKSICSVDRIILVELRPAFFGVPHNLGRVVNYYYGQCEQYRRYMEKGYRTIKKYLEGCYIIEMPDNVIGDIEHKWGRGPLHYVPEYYDYGYEAIRLITENDGQISKSGIDKKLYELKKEYDIKFSGKYLKRLMGLCVDVFVYKKYERFIQTFVLDQKIEKLVEVLKEKYNSRCALYAVNKSADALISLLALHGVSIEYIIHNRDTVYKGINCVAYNSASYQEIPIVLTCSVYPLGDDMKRRFEALNIPYSTPYELIGLPDD